MMTEISLLTLTILLLSVLTYPSRYVIWTACLLDKENGLGFSLTVPRADKKVKRESIYQTFSYQCRC